MKREFHAQIVLINRRLACRSPVAQVKWYSTCLTSMKPSVQTPVLKGKKKVLSFIEF
jgi:hypothetical protein